MTNYSYPKVRTTAEDDDSTAERQEDYDMSDPDRSKINPLESAKGRCALFDKVAANEAD